MEYIKLSSIVLSLNISGFEGTMSRKFETISDIHTNCMKCTWISGENYRQFRLLTWTSLIGQFVHRVKEEGMK